jgi:hypothetical protein
MIRKHLRIQRSTEYTLMSYAVMRPLAWQLSLFCARVPVGHVPVITIYATIMYAGLDWIFNRKVSPDSAPNASTDAAARG